MPGNASITIDIKAQISNLKQILAEMQKEANKIDIGSALGKSLSREISNAEKQLDNLGKNANVRITSEGGIDSLTNKLENVGTHIREIGEEMQKVKLSDINGEALENAVKDLRSQWEQTKTLLEEKINLGLTEELAKTPKLKKYLEELGVDIEKIDAVSTQSVLAENLEEAGKKAADAAIKLGQLQEEYKRVKQEAKDITADDSFYSKLEQSLGSLKDVDFKVENVLNPEALESKIQSWEKHIDELNKYTDQQKQIFKDTIRDYFNFSSLSELNTDEIKHYIDQFSIEFKNIFSSIGGTNQGDFLKLVFGRTSGITEADVKKLFQLDQGAITAGKEALSNLLAQFNPDELGQKETKNIQGLLDKGEIEKAAQATIALLEAKFREVQEKAAELQSQSADLLKQTRTAGLEYGRANQVENTARDRYNEYVKEVEALKEQNRDLQEQLDSLKQRIDSGRAGIAENIKRAGQKGANTSNDELVEATKNANLYKTELQQVQEKEKLIGKIEGVVQRWFSIYAAVRMVGNAIRSVISTVKELDKTITEIAIVTDMTQDDLWKQMSDYTDMARQYASSISGVYQVSQLYYQQGGFNI